MMVPHSQERITQSRRCKGYDTAGHHGCSQCTRASHQECRRQGCDQGLQRTKHHCRRTHEHLDEGIPRRTCLSWSKGRRNQPKQACKATWPGNRRSLQVYFNSLQLSLSQERITPSNRAPIPERSLQATHVVVPVRIKSAETLAPLDPQTRLQHRARSYPGCRRQEHHPEQDQSQASTWDEISVLASNQSTRALKKRWHSCATSTSTSRCSSKSASRSGRGVHEES